VQEVFARIRDERPRIDILVNAVWGGYERMMVDGEFTWAKPFWEQPLWRWDAMFEAGVRAYYRDSQLVAPRMIVQRSGLIANISHWPRRHTVATPPTESQKRQRIRSRPIWRTS
jgi:dehydrogenase/reductase SDR family protein 1